MKIKNLKMAAVRGLEELFSTEGNDINCLRFWRKYVLATNMPPAWFPSILSFSLCVNCCLTGQALIVYSSSTGHSLFLLFFPYMFGESYFSGHNHKEEER